HSSPRCSARGIFRPPVRAPASERRALAETGDSEFFHAELEGRALQSQARCCAPRSGENPPGLFHSSQDKRPFCFFQRSVVPTILTGRGVWMKTPERDLQYWARGQNHRALNQVLQFTDISRPTVTGEGL